MKTQKICFLMLGSNMGDRKMNLKKAKALLQKRVGSLLAESEIYESEPWGYEEEVSYYNQAVKLDTKLQPNFLLKECLLIEEELGRIRTKDTYEARPIDIDILFYEDKVMKSEDLIIPHPRISERRFVLEPLSNIAPDLVHPVLNTSIVNLLQRCNDACWVKAIK